MNTKLLLSVFFLTLFSLFGCSKVEQGDDNIDAYVKANNLTVQKTADGLQYIIEAPGNQLRKPRVNSDVRVDYKGYLLNGSVFDKNPNLVINLSNVIVGWKKGMTLFGEKGKGKLLIPSKLAYGNESKSTIPPNSALVFDIELLEVIN
jgi:FKBP-type peptidyl-prolyl cis-trans isomerase FkpA